MGFLRGRFSAGKVAPWAETRQGLEEKWHAGLVDSDERSSRGSAQRQGALALEWVEGSVRLGVQVLSHLAVAPVVVPVRGRVVVVLEGGGHHVGLGRLPGGLHQVLLLQLQGVLGQVHRGARRLAVDAAGALGRRLGAPGRSWQVRRRARDGLGGAGVRAMVLADAAQAAPVVVPADGRVRPDEAEL